MTQKYVNIKAALNFIPSVIRNDESDGILLSYIFQGYRINVLNDSIVYDYRLCLTEIKNHTAKLPTGALQVASVLYSKEKPDNTSDPEIDKWFITTNTNFADYEDHRILIYQALTYTSFQKYAQPLKYIGSNPELLTFNCINLYCDECTSKFSIDKSMCCVTTDQKDGWLVVMYKTTVTDSDDNLLIPDDADLLNGLGFYAEAMYWRNTSAAGEGSAEQKFDRRYYQASKALTSYTSKHKLRNINPDSFAHFIFNRFGMQKLPAISGKYRQKWRRL